MVDGDPVSVDATPEKFAQLVLLSVSEADIRRTVESQAPKNGITDRDREAKLADLEARERQVEKQQQEFRNAPGRFTKDGVDRWLIHFFSAAYLNAFALAPVDHVGRKLTEKREIKTFDILGIKNALMDGALFEPTAEARMDLLNI
jgi:hypothetical protein